MAGAECIWPCFERHSINCNNTFCRFPLSGLGALIFGYFESWSPMEGAYFSFITLSTIGFGDFVPGSEVGASGVSPLQYYITISAFQLIIFVVLLLYNDFSHDTVLPTLKVSNFSCIAN